MSSRGGEMARYAGRRAKTFQTALGLMTLERAYYCCHCGKGLFPRDRSLGLQETSLSPSVTRMIGATAAMVSFEESSALLGELAAVLTVRLPVLAHRELPRWRSTRILPRRSSARAF